MTVNKLALNIKKSNFVSFHQYQNWLAYQLKLCIFDNEKNNYVSLEFEVKILGHSYWWDSLLEIPQWFHWHKIAKLQSYGTVPWPILLNIYSSLIHPYVTYGLSAWGQACKTCLNKILILQKRALRLLYFTEWHNHAIPLSLEANMLPKTFVYYECISALMYDTKKSRQTC